MNIAALLPSESSYLLQESGGQSQEHEANPPQRGELGRGVGAAARGIGAVGSDHSPMLSQEDNGHHNHLQHTTTNMHSLSVVKLPM